MNTFEGKVVSSGIKVGIVASRFNAVSYTHLDVYKRQVCIYADEYESGGCALPLKNAGWYKIYGIGRDGGYAMMAYNQKLTSVDESNILRNPCLCYTFSLSSDGEFELELIRFLTLDSRGRIRVGIGIDGGEPFVIESDTTDEWRGRWHDSCLLYTSRCV